MYCEYVMERKIVANLSLLGSRSGRVNLINIITHFERIQEYNQTIKFVECRVDDGITS